MLEINENAVKKRENDLIRFSGFIPFDLWLYIDMFKRNNYLKSIGKFDNVQKENAKVRGDMDVSADADLYSEKVLRKWIGDNPKFKDIVVEI